MHNKKSKLGQNFLKSSEKINQFLDFCATEKTDNILEIGPGRGALTKRLCKQANKVIAVELDYNLAKNLKYEVENNLIVINENFLKVNLKELIKKYKITKIVGAIPYYISSPIVHKILEEATQPLKEACLITQKEFAEKIIGTPKKRSYFTNLVEKYGVLIKGKEINKRNFTPEPKVDSLYFKIVFKKYPQNINEVKRWSKFLHHIFLNPRKKINKKFGKEFLQKLNINPNKRPQELSLNEINLLMYNQKNDKS